MDLAVFYY